MIKKIPLKDAINEVIATKLKPNFRENLQRVNKFLSNPLVRELVLNIPYCNLSCKYCYANPKKYNANDIVHKSLVKDFKEKISALAGKVKTSKTIRVVSSYVGESLLFQKELVDIAKHIEKTFHSNKIEYLFLTNGTISLIPEFINFFKTRTLFFNISFDFSPNIHDRFRTTVNGSPTSNKVIRFIQEIKKKGFLIKKIRATIPRGGLSIDEILEFFEYKQKNLKDENIEISTEVDYVIKSHETPSFPTFKKTSSKEIETYKLFFVMNSIIFKDDNIKFVIISQGPTQICPLLHQAVLSPGENKIKGCPISSDPSVYYGIFEDKKFRYCTKIKDVKDLLDRSRAFCINCPIYEFCGLRSCILIKKGSYCHFKPFVLDHIINIINQEHKVYPIFEKDNKVIKLHHPTYTISFHKLGFESISQNVFLWSSSVEEAIFFLKKESLFKNKYKLILIHNLKQVTSENLNQIKKLIKNLKVFVVFSRYIPNVSQLGEKVIFPRNCDENIDRFFYDKQKRLLRTDLGEIKNFNPKTDIIKII